MKIYFLRHADAVEGANDAIRPLSHKGEKQAQIVGEFLLRAGVEFDAAYSSPLLRAQQTAELVLKVTNSAKKSAAQSVHALENEATSAEFNRWLKELPAARQILLVGHAPSLSERAAHLVGIMKPGVIDLPKAGLACVEIDGLRSTRFVFLVTPKLLAE